MLGCSSKGSIDGMIGKFGEGYKLALIVLLRKGFKVDIINADEEWKPRFANSEKFDTQVLTIDVKSLSTENEDCILKSFILTLSVIWNHCPLVVQSLNAYDMEPSEDLCRCLQWPSVTEWDLSSSVLILLC